MPLQQRAFQSRVVLTILLSENAKNDSLNSIHRITCIRKLLEHTNSTFSNYASYNIISSLLHGKDEPTYRDDSKMEASEVSGGEAYIKESISDFSYKEYHSNNFTKDNLLSQFVSENNSYYKLQIFRVILAVCDLRSKIQNDSLIKYIDEQFHVENDSIYYLNLTKFDLVPDFVIPTCEQFLKDEGIL